MKQAGQETVAELLLRLQQGIPIQPRPFRGLARELGLTEKGIVAELQRAFESGVARRFGAIFDARSLGYQSTLCAVDVEDDALEDIAARLVAHPGITHCYERKGRPNLWFTMTAPADALDRELDGIAVEVAPRDLLSLPALRVFKIAAVFDARERTPNDDEAADAPVSAPVASRAGASRAAPLSDRERSVVRKIQGSLPLVEDPLAVVAAALGYGHDELVDLLKDWQGRGILRRIGLVVRHRELGFTANSMCVWKAGPDAIEMAGRTMAGHPGVTHCYERPAFDSFPFNLYAMVHADSLDGVQEIFRTLSERTGLAEGRMMLSGREFKKASPVFFRERTDVPAENTESAPGASGTGGGEGA